MHEGRPMYIVGKCSSRQHSSVLNDIVHLHRFFTLHVASNNCSLVAAFWCLCCKFDHNSRGGRAFQQITKDAAIALSSAK